MSANVVYFIDTMTTRLPPFLHVGGCGSVAVAIAIATTIVLSGDMDAGSTRLNVGIAAHDVEQGGGAVVIGCLTGAGSTGVAVAAACSMGPAVVECAMV
jgi:hypothetical protein